MANSSSSTPTQPLLGLIESPSRFHAARRQRAATTSLAGGGGSGSGRRSRASSDAANARPPSHAAAAAAKPQLHRLLSDLGPRGGTRYAATHGKSFPGGGGVSEAATADERTPLLPHSHAHAHGQYQGEGTGILVNALGIDMADSYGGGGGGGGGVNPVGTSYAAGTRSTRSMSVTSSSRHHPPFVLASDGLGGFVPASSTNGNTIISSGNGSAQPPSSASSSFATAAAAAGGRVRPASSSSWRTMLRAPSQLNTPTLRVIDTPDGEAIVVTRPKRRRHPLVRYTRTLWSGAHWKAVFHLVVLNIPFVLLLWPLLVVGTLTGTVLLITLPLGALIWFITLILARSACRLELKMQLFFHSPLRSSIPRPVYFPIFRRIKLSPGADGQVRPVVEVYGQGDEAEVAGIVHERNFFKNCWSMFSDHVSYQCLYYLVVTKALITLLSSLVILVLLPVSAALIVPLPGALELVRRFGRWQAGVAVEGLQ